jgi:hypothetical protein
VASPVISVRRTRLRPARFADYPQISALEARYGLESKTEEEWTHLWRCNTLYQELKADFDIGWVVEDTSREIVASLSSIPLAYEIGGKRVIAISGRGQVAHPNHRGASLMLLNKLIHQPGADLYLNNTMNSTALASFKQFECPRVPSGVWDRVAFWITEPRGFCRRVLQSEKRALARLLGPPLAVSMAGVNRFLDWTCWERPKIEHEIRTPDNFDEGFDEFWETLRLRKPNVLLAVRSRAVLQWHFHALKARHRLWIATISEGARLGAYAAFERCDNQRLGITRMRLVDFQSLHNDPSVFLSLLGWALRECRRRGIHLLEITGAGLGRREVVERIAPYRRKLSNWTYFYKALDAALAERLQNPQAWEPSLYDGDATL